MQKSQDLATEAASEIWAEATQEPPADSVQSEAAKQSSAGTVHTHTETGGRENAAEDTRNARDAAVAGRKPDTGSNEKAASVLDKAGGYVKLYQANKELIFKVLGIVFKSLKTMLPGMLEVEGTFGTGRADLTGYIYGAYCSLKQYLPGSVYLEPIWTEAYLAGKYRLKGKVRIFPLIAAIIRIVANREVRLLYKKIRSV